MASDTTKKQFLEFLRGGVDIVSAHIVRCKDCPKTGDQPGCAICQSAANWLLDADRLYQLAVKKW